MPPIDADHAKQAIRAASGGGAVKAAGTTSAGRATAITFAPEAADLIVERATQVEWVESDSDGYHVWILTPGGRWYRMDAVDPDGPPRTI